MAGNPLSYKDLFDFTENGGIKSAIKDINKLHDAYQSFINTVIQGQLDAVIRQQKELALSAKQLSDATKDLNITTKDGQKALIENAKLMDQLEKTQKKLAETKAATKKVDDSAASSINALNKKLAEQIEAYKQASSASQADRDEMNKLAASINRTRENITAMTSAIKINVNGFQAAKGSYAELDAQTRQLVTKAKNLSDAFGANKDEAALLQKQIRENTEKLKDFDKQMGQNFRNVGNYKDAIAGLGDELKSNISQLFTLSAGFALVSAVVKNNIQISDSLADVQRTAQLTTPEINDLVDSLKKIDTRTSLKGLVDIAIIGGQLGIAKDQLTGFTQVVDQLAVVLSSEIPGGAEAVATALGKINGVFKVQQKEGTDAGEALSKTGSAILKLGQEGLATGEFLQDFTQRVSGTADVAKISLPVILAYGAVLEETGSSAEVAGTAFNRLVGVLASKKDNFFQIAKIADSKLTLQEFTKYVNTDANKALQLFFKGLNAGGTDLESFNNLLADLNIKAGPARNAIIELAKNQDKLSERIASAKTEYQKGTLAADQFKIKNDNLAGSVDKLVNVFVNATTSGRIANFFNQGVIAARVFLEEMNKIANSRSFSEVIARLTTFNGGATYDATNSIKDNFTTSKKSTQDLTKATGNNDFTNKSVEQLSALIPQYKRAYETARKAYTDYIKGTESGLLKDGGEVSLQQTKKNYTTVRALLEDVTKAYAVAKSKVDAVKKVQLPVTTNDLTTLAGIRKEISNLSKQPGSADPSSEVGQKITELKQKLKDFSASAKEPKDALEVLQDRLKKLNSELNNGLADGKIDDADKRLFKQIDAAQKQINQILELRDKLQRGTYQRAKLPDDTNIDKRTTDALDASDRKNNNLLNAADFARQAEQVELKYAELNANLTAAYRDHTLTREQYDVQAAALATSQSNERYFAEKARLNAQLQNEKEGSKQYIYLKEQEANLEKKHSDDQIRDAERAEAARLKSIDIIINALRKNIQPIADILGTGFGTIFSALTDDLENFVKNGKLKFEDFVNTAGSLVSGLNDIFKQSSNERISQLETERTADLASAGNNTAAQLAINKRYDQEIAKQKRKQAIADKEAALFAIAVNTAVATSKTLGETGIFGIPLLPLIIGLGLAQAALVLAKPLPKYFKGRDGGPEELAELNEKGPELLEKNGKFRFANAGKRGIGFLQSGEKVHTAEKTAKILSEQKEPERFVDSLIRGTLIVRAHEQNEKQELLKVIAGSYVSKEDMHEAFSEAIKDLPIQQLVQDEKGNRTYILKRNQRILDQNARNTTGGNG